MSRSHHVLLARYYDPATGQFLTRDPAEAVTRSAYGYVGNNPINATDPTGLICLGSHCVHMPSEVKHVAHAVATGASVLAIIPGPTSNVFSAVAVAGYGVSGDWRNAAIMTVGLVFGVTGSYMVGEMRALTEAAEFSSTGFQVFRTGVYGSRSLLGAATTDLSWLERPAGAEELSRCGPSGPQPS